jgi:acetyl-CoA acetyltransferase
MKKQKLRDVAVLGVGMHPFGRFADKTFVRLAGEALWNALQDAGMQDTKKIDAIIYCHAMGQTLAAGELVSYEFGMSGIPILGNVENACSSSSAGVWLSNKLIGAGIYDIIAIVGCEKMPPGAFEDPLKSLPDRYLGLGLIMATYAMRTRRYMMEYGASIEALAQVSVKAHHWGCFNPDAQFKKKITVADVLNARMIADPLTLYMVSPTSEGAAAVILCAAEIARRHSSKPVVRIAGSAVTSEKYSDGAAHTFAEHTARAAQEAYGQAEISPKDVDLAEVHDAASIGELIRSESMGLLPVGEGWKWTMEGKTDRLGSIPINISGGLKACGHPLGATGARQIVEITRQLRNEAGERQVPNAKIGLAETAGFGGVACVNILATD